MTARVLTAIAVGLLLAAGATGQEKNDRDPFQGKWVIVSMERDGKDVTREGVKLTLTFRKGAYTLPSAGGFTKSQEGTYKWDPAKKPRTFDIIPTDGPNKGKTFPGIYEITGDTLKACFDAAGKERPTEFTAKGGSGRVLVIYRRQKE